MRFSAPALGVILLLAGTASAEQPAPAPPIDSTRRDVGAALVAGGVAFGGVGVGMYFLTKPNGDRPCDCSTEPWVFPAVLMGLGGAMAVAGVPLWITGQINMDRSSPRAELQIGPLGGSVRLLF